MKRRNAFWPILFTLVILYTLPAVAESPIAILLSCRGNVVVVRNAGGSEKGSFGMPLFTGD
ncbi:MAG: hypothetical protein KAX38_03390, partial [Candidatus Krumholzibacteria bacterium]|nr:hypothetical protein [Candidatus Krumholzibacteria bacterium]